MFAYAFPLVVLVAAIISAASYARPPHDREFDYIVVGGGTAGNALATRLSQRLRHSKILVIEAGPVALHEDGINVPGLRGSTLGGKYDWNFTTVPQTHLKNRSLFTPRGRVLGGSSALNLMAWDRAAAAEFDQWEEVGNPGWNWNSMTAAMEKSETFHGGPSGSGTSGPIQAVFNRGERLHQDAFIPAVTSSSPIQANPDSLQGNPIGVMFQPSSIAPASYNRSYSANAYLPLAGPNLSILSSTLVSKLNLRQTNQGLHRVTGVTLANGTTISARKEVIVSAGAISTPQLLELSGIGRRSVLRAASIPALIDLPGVGENYQDHLRVQISYQLKDEYLTRDELLANATFAAEEWAKRLAGQPSFYDDSKFGFVFANWKQVVPGGDDSGLVGLARAAVGGSRDVGHRKKLEQLADPAVPQAEILYVDGYIGEKGYPPVGSPLRGKGFVTLVGGLMHPLSRGSVHVNAANPSGPPVLDPRFLDNEYDLEGLVEILKFLRRIARAEPLRSLWVDEYEPGEDVVVTDDDWREYVRDTLNTIFHPMGTAAMLPRKDGGVVDSELIVYGTENLRVADASVIPVEISAHPQTAVYGIAERAADIIVGKHH
ncbi:hypothetical protein MFIFM68171_01743 [Madurella fahalii]|uniref:Glucose-methanol-choline oxidoreductase N-terminal domain-containing protein n=1 Tax=Madurella fahalii TaxID=1157608 RepID=A0ABQ0G1A2_9PEZI